MKHYFKVFYRNLFKNKRYAFLNIASLTVGLTASMLIMLWVLDEFSFDQFHTNKDRLYQVWDTQRYSGSVFTFQSTPGPLAEGLKAQFPEVANATRLFEATGLLSFNEKSFTESGIYTDASFFDMFTFPLVSGNSSKLLENNSSIVVSERLAKKLFGDGEVLGKSIRFQNKYDFMVTGIFKDVPQNSTLQFDYVLPFEVLIRENEWLTKWGANGLDTYITLNDSKDEEKVNEKIHHFVNQYDKESIVELFIWPYAKSRLYSNFVDGKPAGGGIKNARNMTIVALIILAMAIINFVNLSTARSAVRAKEVGVKKVVGAARWQLISQFIVESFGFTLIATIVAMGLAYLLIPFYNQVTQKHLVIDFFEPSILLGLLVVVLATAILAGLYPAFLLSSLKPSAILKGKSDGGRGALLRKALVVIQFGMTVILLSTVFTVFKQVDFILNKDVGYRRDNVLIYRPSAIVKQSSEAFFREVRNLSGVLGVSSAQSVPYNIGNNGDFEWEGKPKDQQVLVQNYGVDYDLIPTMQMKIIKGRNFSRDIASDSNAVIISKQLADIMAFDDPIGKKVNEKYSIIGVVSDFNSWSLYEGLNPLLMRLDYDHNRVFVKVAPNQANEMMKKLEVLHKKYDDVFPFSSDLMDDGFKRQYSFETTMGKLSSAFTIIAVLVSCLGLIGLVSYTAEKRAKEIGVRKVLGASISGVVLLLFKDFGKLIVLASLLSVPISFYAVNDYLEKFAYHFQPSPLLFVLPCLAVFVLAFISVFYQSFKAASTNPTEVLRSE
jgi:putative ABC transport system permease protein